jgi:hypothetical protein
MLTLDLLLRASGDADIDPSAVASMIEFGVMLA